MRTIILFLPPLMVVGIVLAVGLFCVVVLCVAVLVGREIISLYKLCRDGMRRRRTPVAGTGTFRIIRTGEVLHRERRERI